MFLLVLVLVLVLATVIATEAPVEGSRRAVCEALGIALWLNRSEGSRRTGVDG